MVCNIQICQIPTCAAQKQMQPLVHLQDQNLQCSMTTAGEYSCKGANNVGGNATLISSISVKPSTKVSGHPQGLLSSLRFSRRVSRKCSCHVAASEQVRLRSGGKHHAIEPVGEIT